MGFSRKSGGANEKSENSWSVNRLVTRLKKKKNSDLDDFMVIGIDFGQRMSTCDLVVEAFIRLC